MKFSNRLHHITYLYFSYKIVRHANRQIHTVRDANMNRNRHSKEDLDFKNVKQIVVGNHNWLQECAMQFEAGFRLTFTIHHKFHAKSNKLIETFPYICKRTPGD
jgi:hypothetical protein